jgi:hypothetical protein
MALAPGIEGGARPAEAKILGYRHDAGEFRARLNVACALFAPADAPLAIAQVVAHLNGAAERELRL